MVWCPLHLDVFRLRVSFSLCDSAWSRHLLVVFRKLSVNPATIKRFLLIIKYFCVKYTGPILARLVAFFSCQISIYIKKMLPTIGVATPCEVSNLEETVDVNFDNELESNYLWKCWDLYRETTTTLWYSSWNQLTQMHCMSLRERIKKTSSDQVEQMFIQVMDHEQQTFLLCLLRIVTAALSDCCSPETGLHCGCGFRRQLLRKPHWPCSTAQRSGRSWSWSVQVARSDVPHNYTLRSCKN